MSSGTDYRTTRSAVMHSSKLNDRPPTAAQHFLTTIRQVDFPRVGAKSALARGNFADWACPFRDPRA
jgi:hypothetical protein